MRVEVEILILSSSGHVSLSHRNILLGDGLYNNPIYIFTLIWHAQSSHYKARGCPESLQHGALPTPRHAPFSTSTNHPKLSPLTPPNLVITSSSAWVDGAMHAPPPPPPLPPSPPIDRLRQGAGFQGVRSHGHLSHAMHDCKVTGPMFHSNWGCC